MSDKNVTYYQADGTPVSVKAVEQADGSFAMASVAGKTVIASAELKRPADTNPYAIKDAVANSTTGANVTMLEFAGSARSLGGGGSIAKVRLMTDKKDDASLYRLHLYHTAPAAALRVGDNSPFTFLWANRASRVGMIDLPALSTEDATGSTGAGATAGNGVANMPMPYQCAAADNKLYGLLEILTALTPASEQNYFVELTLMEE